MPPLAWLFLAATAIITLFWFLAARGYWEDDAYIHLEFARSLAAGNGFAFNNHLVYGDTSPLWVWLLVAAHAVVPNWLAAGKLLTVVVAVAALTGFFFYSRSLVRRWWHPAAADVFAATMLLTFVLSPYFGYWAFSGMEALAAAGLACWTCFLIAPRHLTWQRILLAALLAGFAPLLRPEMAFFTLLVGCVLLQRIRNMHASLTVRADVFIAGLVLAAVVGLALGARTHRRRGRHVLVRGRRHDGDALVGEAFDALQLAALAAVAERQSDARGAGARGAADAMDVALGVGRQLEVDDVGHAAHVDAARGEIGGNQHAGLAAREVVERLLTGVL